MNQQLTAGLTVTYQVNRRDFFKLSASAAFASATLSGFANSTVIASLWAIRTGTRTQVGQTPID